MKSLVGIAVAALVTASTPVLAQATNEGKPDAPAPAKAAPLETGGKPTTTTKGSEASSGTATKAKKHKHKD